MTTYVADTHALIWHLVESRRLGRAARRAFAAADERRGQCYVPAIVLAEIWLLYERGRIRINPRQVLEVLAGHEGYVVLALDLEQALELGALGGIRDPIDRLVVASARVIEAKLLSRDEALDGHGVARIWD